MSTDVVEAKTAEAENNTKDPLVGVVDLFNLPDHATGPFLSETDENFFRHHWDGTVDRARILAKIFHQEEWRIRSWATTYGLKPIISSQKPTPFAQQVESASKLGSALLSQVNGLSPATVGPGAWGGGVAVKRSQVHLPENTEKECKGCHKMRPLEQFRRANRSVDGRSHLCLTCRPYTEAEQMMRTADHLTTPGTASIPLPPEKPHLEKIIQADQAQHIRELPREPAVIPLSLSATTSHASAKFPQVLPPTQPAYLHVPTLTEKQQAKGLQILYDLTSLLPEDHHWTRDQRQKWFTAVQAVTALVIDLDD